MAETPATSAQRSDTARAGLAWLSLGLLAAALLLPGLGGIDLWAPDEPRYAQIAQEVLDQRNGASDLVLLRIAGEPYTQKPPLYYWLAALAGAYKGQVSEAAARIPSALAGIACVVGTAYFGFVLFGRRLGPGLWAGALLLTTWRFAFSARRAQLDVLLTLFEGIALLACWHFDQGRRSRGTTLLVHTALGLAVLTKGPVGLLPLLAYAIYLGWEGRLREIRPLLAPWGFLVSLGPALLWLGAATLLAPPGFFSEAVGDNVLGRFFSGTAHVRPFYYYAYQLPADALPWILLAPLVWIAWRSPWGAAGPAGAAWRLLGCAAATTLAFFSLSAGKRGVYLLPIFPWLALLAGASLDLLVRGALAIPPALARVFAYVATGLGGIAALAGLALALASAIGFEPSGLNLGSILPSGFGLAVAAAGALLLVGAWGTSPPKALRLGEALGLGIASAAIALAASFQLALPGLDPAKSARPIAQEAARLAPAGTPIGVFHHQALIGAMAYYGDIDSHPIHFVHTVADLPRFLAKGGKVLVARERFRPELAEAHFWPDPFSRSWRTGDRRVELFVPSGETTSQAEPMSPDLREK